MEAKRILVEPVIKDKQIINANNCIYYTTCEKDTFMGENKFNIEVDNQLFIFTDYKIVHIKRETIVFMAYSEKSKPVYIYIWN